MICYGKTGIRISASGRRAIRFMLRWDGLETKSESEMNSASAPGPFTPADTQCT